MSKPVEDLINEVRLLYQLMVQKVEEVHSDSSVSVGMRAILEFLNREGATTVPNMARARNVTRQRIQALVNPLAELDLVETLPNPASLRSPLIGITELGAQTIRGMRRKEGEVFKVALEDSALKQATNTLRLLRTELKD